MSKSNLNLEVYEALCQRFAEGISEEKKEEFCSAYLAFLHKEYDSDFENATEEKVEGIACYCVKKEKLLRLSMTEDDKQAFLFPDEVYLELESICVELIGAARQKQDGENVCMSASYDEYYSRMKEKFSNVSELFRFTAERMLSEGILALNYIFKDSPYMGLFMRKIEKKDEVSE